MELPREEDEGECGMSKERIDYIKETYEMSKYDVNFFLGMGDIDWLIEQAERVQDLEGDAENIYRANHDYSRRNDILTQQNKCYREAMKKIWKLTETDAGTEEQVFIIADDILKQDKEEVKKPDDRTVESPHSSWF